MKAKISAKPPTPAPLPEKKAPAKAKATKAKVATAKVANAAAAAKPAKPAKLAASPAPAKAELPTLFFEDATAFEAWLADNHTGPGVWLKFAKKGTGIRSLDYAGALDVALAWGFIDGQSKGGDTHYTQRFVPRGPKSIWSKINREKIARLEAAGKMTPRGQAEVARAKADGRWDAAYDPPSRVTVPDDLAAALEAEPAAKAFFATLDAQNRYAILHRLQVAKRPVTRQRNLEKFVQMLLEKRVLHQR